ncbi:MAG: 4Fe-4S dicluster domain-containing protein, partial [Acidobacteriota bacterium]|nr:4Fe-4S dicluster domain-containing protein [Acidobacteriota bacterium]
MKRYFKDIFQSIWTVLQGMKITGLHLFTRSCTLQYPSVKWELPERSRMRLFNKIEDCIGCGQCVRACPVDCIYMTTERRNKEEPPIFAADGTPIKLRVTQFDIDMSL